MAEIPASPTATVSASRQRITDGFAAMNEVNEEEAVMMPFLVRTNNGEARATGTRIDLHEDGLNGGIFEKPIHQADREREALHDASAARLQESSRPSGSTRHQRPMLPVLNKHRN